MPSGRQSKTRCGASGRGVRDRVLPAVRAERARRDEDARGVAAGGRPRARTGRARRRRSPRRRSGGSSSRSARICEVGARSPGSARERAAAPPGVGSAPKRSRRRSTRLTCACASGVSSQTQRTPTPWRAGGLDDVAPRRAGEVRVVEDDASAARAASSRRAPREVAERAAALVPVEPQVPARDEAARRRGSCPPLECPSRATTSPRRVRFRGRRGRAARRTVCRERWRDPRASSRAAPRARRNAPSPACRAPGIATIVGCEVEQPGEGDLGRCRVVRDPRRAVASSMAVEAAAPAPGPPSGEWARSASPRSSQRSTTPPRRARSSNGVSATSTAATGASSSASSSWRAIDVRDARRGGRGPRRRAARGRERSSARASAGRVRGRGRGRSGARRAPRGSPRSRRGSPSRGRRGASAAVARHPAFRHDPRPLAGARASERTGQQPLVVAELGLVAAVRARSVEHGDSRVGRRRDRRERALLVAVLVGGEAHAAEADAELRRIVEPGRRGQARRGYVQAVHAPAA